MESRMPTKFDQKYAAIRQTVIEQSFAHLNPEQREAVYTTEGPLLILAGAGSGKTTVLINRIIHILRFGQGRTCPFAPDGATQDDLRFLTEYMTEPKPENRRQAEALCAVSPAKPWEIIAITFTNKAANELRSRLRTALEDEHAAAAVWAHTFHTACLRILRNHTDLLGFASPLTIYDEDDKKRIITNLLKRMKLEERMFDPRTVMNRISRAKDHLKSPGQLREEAGGSYFLTMIADIYEQYEKEMKQACALDFDDIIMKTVLLLQQHPDVLKRYQHQFRYVLVDEYQDTNYAQYVLISLLAGYYQNICVVGDDDQSIYKFRGATITNILEFEQQFKNAKTIRLEQNYRSTQTILNAANTIIQNNLHRKGKKLWTVQDSGEKIHLRCLEDQKQEAEYIAEVILDEVGKGRHWNDFAILYRNNILSDNLVTAFTGNQIPYRVYKGRDFFTRAEIRDMFAYLWVLENPSDEMRLLRIINVPARKIGGKSVETALKIAEDNGITLYEVICHASAYAELKRTATAMQRFGAMMESLRQQKNNQPLTELYDALLEQTGYWQALEDKGGPEEEGRMEHIRELKSSIVRYEQEHQEPTLSGFLEEMSLYTDVDQADDNNDAVTMMTIHSAKGLEFPVVCIIGMNDGLFPSFRALEETEELEEERRLCYVAVTRAKKSLYLTYASKRLLYGRTQNELPSRFLREIEPELLDSTLPDPEQFSEQFGDWPDIQPMVSPQYAPAVPHSPARPAAAVTSLLPDTADAKTTLPDFPVGCRVRHKVFGNGMIVRTVPVNDDMLLEIAFDTKGTKRLMARYVAQVMTRIS